MIENNPFTITFGKQPELLIDRGEIINEVVDMFSAEHSVSQSCLIEGVRGSGKTVLMTTIAKRFVDKEEWVVCDLNSSMDLLADLDRNLSKEVSRIPNIIEKGVNVSAFGFGVGIGGIDKRRDSISEIEDILELLQKKKKRLLITIDEVVCDDNMRIFASQFQIFLRKNYPVYLIMTGLYENIYSIQNDKQLTFLLRSPKWKMSPLSVVAMETEYEDVFGVDENVALRLATITKGYAFAFQALGNIYWEHREELSMDRIIRKLDIALDSYVYSKIWNGLTQQEKQILLVINDDEQISSKEIVKRSNIKESSMSRYRKRLLEKGLLCSREYGSLELTLPRFHHITKMYELR